MRSKQSIREHLSRASEMIRLLSEVDRIEKGYCTTHPQRNAAMHLMRLLHEQLELEVSAALRSLDDLQIAPSSTMTGSPEEDNPTLF